MSITFSPQPQKARKAKVINKLQFKVLKENIRTTADLIAYRAVEIVSYMGIDLLAHAQPRVPWDTGKLRRSGRVHVEANRKSFVIARGSKSGAISVRTNHLNFNSLGRNIGSSGAPNTARVYVSYNRINEKGQDIAIWTHETLNPHDTRPNPPAARKPGTGPKYLEIALNERKQLWMQLFNLTMNKGISADLAKIAGVVRKRKNKYGVDIIKLVRNRINKKGYFGGR